MRALRRPHLALLVVAIVLSGCAGLPADPDGRFGNGKQIAIAGNGQMSGSDSKSLQCSSEGQVAVGFNGQGQITVTVKDGLQQEVYRKAFQGNGQGGETKDLDGTAGDWTLTVTFGTHGVLGQWNGQYGIYLRC